MSCKLCKSSNTKVIFDLREIPANQNKVYDTEDSAKNCKTSNIKLEGCNCCGFVFNADFNEDNIDYSGLYDNNQSLSPYFMDYVNSEVHWLIEHEYISDKDTVVEIGCGKGYYIKTLAEKLKDGIYYGFDTSYDGDLNFPDINLVYYLSYFSDKYSHIKPDISICRHVIEHIENPIDFFMSIRKAIPENSLLFLETPDFDWIIENKTYYDICHEHCSYWLTGTLDMALQSSGFDLVESLHGFEGQYLWVVARAVKMPVSLAMPKGQAENLAVNNLNSKEAAAYKELLQKLKQYAQSNNIAVWGAGAKGCCFLNLTDTNRQFFSHVIDINPNKQNKFIGKTAHPIISPEQIRDNTIGAILIMNPNYEKEIQQMLISLEYKGYIFSVTSNIL